MNRGSAKEGQPFVQSGQRYARAAASASLCTAAADRIRRTIAKIRGESAHRVRADLDQCPATPSTVLRRCALLTQLPASRTAAILLIGDDDLLSVALATGQVRSRIAVLDADRTLLRLIARHTGSAVEVIRADIRKGLPAVLHHRFDQVFTDPPYTFAGQLLFVQRAMLALRPRPGTSLYVCASRVYLTSEEISRVRRFLNKGGFELQSAYPRFNRYRAPGDVQDDLKRLGHACTTWLHSDLLRYVRCRPRTVPDIPRDIIARIYMYEHGGMETRP